MLEVKDLFKKFKNDDRMILENINLTVNSGEIVGLLGKNGAGKTTLMKIIAKTKRPTSGQIMIDGKDIFQHDGLLQDVGIMIDTVYFDHLSAEQNLKYFLQVNQQTQYLKNIDQILELVGLRHTKNKKAKDFSFGMKQRLSLAMCLLIEPKLAIMDEPFVGLDPNGVKTLIEALKKWVKNRKISLLISSHQLNELEEVCDRFVILKNGHLRAINLNKMNGLKIIVDRNITEEDAEKLKYDYSIVERIEGDSIFIKETVDNYNDLLTTVLTKYTLVKIDKPQQDLYDAFDYYENKGGA